MNNNIEFVIPAFGDSLHLEECLKSLMMQNLKCQISICTSTPSEYLKQVACAHNIPLIINPRRDSIASDWNFALEHAQANLVVLAHQDDLYAPQFAQKAKSFFDINADVAIAFTDSIELLGNNASAYTKREVVKKLMRSFAFLGRPSIETRFSMFRLLAFGCPIPCPSVIFNRKVSSRYLFSSDYSVNLDWDLWSRIGKARLRIGYINELLLTHRIHENAETQAAIKELRRHKEDHIIFMRYWPKSIAKIVHFFYKFGY